MKFLSFITSFFVVFTFIFSMFTNRQPFILCANSIFIVAILIIGIALTIKITPNKTTKIAWGMIWGTSACLVLCFAWFMFALKGLTIK